MTDISQFLHYGLIKNYKKESPATGVDRTGFIWPKLCMCETPPVGDLNVSVGKAVYKGGLK